jgi:hypothetical protein
MKIAEAPNECLGRIVGSVPGVDYRRTRTFAYLARLFPSSSPASPKYARRKRKVLI